MLLATVVAFAGLRSAAADYSILYTWAPSTNCQGVYYESVLLFECIDLESGGSFKRSVVNTSYDMITWWETSDCGRDGNAPSRVTFSPKSPKYGDCDGDADARSSEVRVGRKGSYSYPDLSLVVKSYYASSSMCNSTGRSVYIYLNNECYVTPNGGSMMASVDFTFGTWEVSQWVGSDCAGDLDQEPLLPYINSGTNALLNKCQSMLGPFYSDSFVGYLTDISGNPAQRDFLGKGTPYFSPAFPQLRPGYVAASGCGATRRKAGPSGADISLCRISGDVSASTMSVIVFNPYNNRVTITQLGVDETGRAITLPPSELLYGYNFLVTTDLWPSLFSINCTTRSNVDGCAIAINDDTPDGTAQYWFSLSVSLVDPRPLLQAAAMLSAIIGAVVGVALCCCAAAAASKFVCAKTVKQVLAAGAAPSVPTSSDWGVSVTNHGAVSLAAARPPSYPIAPPASASTPQPQQVN